jgi:hypothetical protein
MEMRSGSLPGPLKKLVGSSGTFHTMTEWDTSDPTQAIGKTKMELAGVPVTFLITTILKSDGDHTQDISRVEINAKIPLVGKQIEKYLLPKAERGVIKSHKLVNKHLAQQCESIE